MGSVISLQILEILQNFSNTFGREIHLGNKWMVSVIPYGATLDIFQRWFQPFTETFSINMQTQIKKFYFMKKREWIKVSHK